MGTLTGYRLRMAFRHNTATAWIIAVNVCLALCYWIVAGAGLIAGYSADPLFNLFVLPAPAAEILHQPWSVVTYMWIHFSVLHLLFNMLWFYWFGTMTSDFGRFLPLWLYLGGGVAGAICFEIADAISGGMSASLCGASAAVLAVVAASAVLCRGRKVNLWLFGEVGVEWVAVAAILLTLPGSGLSGALWAHLGGAAYGFCHALCFKHFDSSFVKPLKNMSVLSKSRAEQPQNSPAHSPSHSPSHSPEEYLSQPGRLDELLDRIRLSGYKSLNDKEKDELIKISDNLKNKNEK